MGLNKLVVNETSGLSLVETSAECSLFRSRMEVDHAFQFISVRIVELRVREFREYF